MEDLEMFLKKFYYLDADLYATWVENKVCRTCRKPISGTAFKYLDRDLLFHSSCLNAPTNEKAIMIHFGYPGHDHLIFAEDVKNDGKEDVVCFGCEKPALGPIYKCSTSQCTILFHKSCFELSPQIKHSFHPNHTLLLVAGQNKHCNACGRNCNAYPFYRCSEYCDFNLDFACATRSRIKINTDDCQHKFISLSKPIQFICEACGEEGMEFASQCSICQLLIHTKCAQFPRIIWIRGHDHSLALTYSLHQVKEHNNIFCKLCREKVKIEYGAYYCQKCECVAHLACAFQYEDKSRKWLPEEYFNVETNVHVMQVGAGKQILHFSHQRDLIFSNEELVDEKLCNGCMGLISTPFYSCMQCSFFLHTKCALLPKKKRHQLHSQHQLTLITPSYYLGSFSCHACERSSNGFAYKCDHCHFTIDLQCYSLPEILKHESHQHSIFFAINSNRRCHVCNCTSNKKPGVFACTNCNFALGFECATLPLVARHKYDDHLLKLTYSAEAHCEEYYCLICEKRRDSKHWFYYCAECDFPAHLLCVLGKDPYIKFGKTFTSEYHQHPLTVVPKIESSPPCDACGKTFDGMALECTQCKFNVHHFPSCVRKIT